MMGKLIVIEGTDGSGKQTQTNLLVDNLLALGLRAKRISFPNYESKGSEPVKMFLAGELGSIDQISYFASSCLYAVDRYTSFMSEWREFYEKGGIIICDRYTISNMIHQGNRIKDENEFWNFCDWIMDLEWNKFKLPTPDMIILLDVPYDYSNILMKDRKNKITGEDKKDILESDEDQKLRAYTIAKKIATRFNYSIIECVDGSKLKSIESIQEDILNIVKEKIRHANT